MVPLWLYFIFVIFALLVHLFLERKNVFPYYKSMEGPIGLPLIGCSYFFIGNDIINSLEKLVRRHKGENTGYSSWLGKDYTVLIHRPKDFEIILNNPDALQKAHVYKFLRPIVGNGIFSTTDLTKWKLHRKYIMMSLNQKILNSYVDIYCKQTQIFRNKLQKHVDKGDFDIHSYTMALTIDIIVETTFGYSLNEQIRETSFAKWLQVVQNHLYGRVFKPWLYPDFIFYNTPDGRYSKECCHKVRQFLHKIVKEKQLEYRAKSQNEYDDGSKFQSTLEVLIELSEKGHDISNEQIVDEIITVMIGGADSSSVTVSFAMMLLGMHQDIQNQVYNEQKEIFGDSDRSPTVEDLSDMKLLERVIKETLRLFPIGPVIARQSTAEIDMRTYKIPKNTLIALVIISMHRDPKVWKNPLKFDPDRFLPENFVKTHPYAYIPFSAGPRNCIGPKFAMMSLKCILSIIIRRYKIFCSYPDVASIKVSAHVMIRAIDGNLLSIKNRS